MISSGSYETLVAVIWKGIKCCQNGGYILVALEGTLDVKAEVLGLDGGEGRKLNVAVSQVEAGDLLVQDLGQNIDLGLELAALGKLDILLGELLVVALVEHDLGKHLVGEAARHDKGAVASGAAEVDETALSQQDEVAAVLHEEAVDLGLDVLDGLSIGLEPSNVDLNVEVANV
jgi:hypothetical protein